MTDNDRDALSAVFGLTRSFETDSETGEGDRWDCFVRATASDDGTTLVTASTPDEDSYSDIVAGPWKLARFRKNPVIPFGHDYSALPVGRAKSVRFDSATGHLEAQIQWWDSPLNPQGQAVAEGFRQKYLNAVSVGFRAGKVEKRANLPDDHPHKAERGLYLTNNELLEISAVTIPANPKALAQRGALERAAEIADAGMSPEDLAAEVLRLLREHPEIRAELAAIAAANAAEMDVATLARALAEHAENERKTRAATAWASWT